MNAVEITSEVFASLKPGQIVRVSFSSCMLAAREGLQLRVGRRSHSKKYNVTTVALDPMQGKPSSLTRVKLYGRADGRVSLALGDMATNVTTFEVV